MDLSLDIQTAQNVPLALEPASLGQRILATLADGVVVGAWWMASTVALGASGLFNSTAGFLRESLRTVAQGQFLRRTSENHRG